MRFPSAAALCALISLSSVALSQTTPSTRPAPSTKPDPNSPAQAGRNQLNKYLDDIAAQQTSVRRAAIAAITTRAQAEARQHEVRAQILGLVGGGFEKTPLNAKVLGSTQLDGFRIEKILFDSQPDFPVTALLYLPDRQSPITPQNSGAPRSAVSAPTVGKQKLPAIVIAPGHGAAGKATDYAIASTLARNGFAVLSYDPIGQGERLQYPDPAHPGKSLAGASTGEHAEAGLQPTLIGDAIARFFVWDGVRAVDYLVSRPEIDSERIGAFGCSGGGVMTAMLAAADRRIHAVATACYITTMDTLLPTLGPQDAEQSIPNFISSGFDFADWVELVAPRPYAIVGTVSDMFPWAGLLASATEARRFYALFDSTAAGTPTNAPMPLTPTGPTLNPDTPNTIAPTAPLQVIAGIGGHGNLRPLYPDIVRFFLIHLAHSTAQPVVQITPGAPSLAALSLRVGSTTADASTKALQVTPTGQVATSYPGSATVHTLTIKRAAEKIHPPVHPQTLLQLQTDIREVTNAEAVPGTPSPVSAASSPEDPDHIRHRLRLATDPGITIDAEFYRPTTEGKHPTLLLLRDNLDGSLDVQRAGEIDRFRSLAKAGTAVFVAAPRPSPPGVEDTKSSLLGPFYIIELRAQLVGKTLLGMRVDDVIRVVDFFSTGYTEDPNNITAEASGHLGLVLLHAAVLDPRLKHITIDHTLESYRSLLDAALPIDAPQDILPGVLLKYDIPDLVRILGPRLSLTSPQLPGAP